MANDILFDTFGGAATLTAAINKVPCNFGVLARLKLFQESGIATTEAAIDLTSDLIRLISTAPRGGVGEPFSLGIQGMAKVSAVHLPTSGSVMADEVQDQRQWGTTDFASPLALRDRKLSGMRANLEASLENLRFGAIKGQILDADGSTLILDIYALFGITQTSLSLDLVSSTAVLVNKVIDAERASEDACGGAAPTHFVALSSPSFMDSLRASPSYDRALRYAQPSELLKDFRNSITVGNTDFVECRTPPGLPVRIPAGEAYLVPQGIQSLLLTHYAPGDYTETVNSVGIPIYAKSERMDFDKGYSLEAQSNPLNICTRPKSIIRLTAA